MVYYFMKKDTLILELYHNHIYFLKEFHQHLISKKICIYIFIYFITYVALF